MKNYGAIIPVSEDFCQPQSTSVGKQSSKMTLGCKSLMTEPVNQPVRLKNQRTWKDQLKGAIRSVNELLDYVQISEGTRKNNEYWRAYFDSDFSVRVPTQFADKMEKGNPRDPLLLQVLPVMEETVFRKGYSSDPIQEQRIKNGKIIHKYQGRVLVILTGTCAINCRYCFRREYPYAEEQLTQQEIRSIIDYIQQDQSVSEVILSGGDPLILSDTKIKDFINELEGIPHLKRLRIHSRLPVVIPERLTPRLLTSLSESRLQTSLVLHINHPNEIDETLGAYLRGFRQNGITLLNQTVLLKGVNDKAEVLRDLSESLFAVGLLPYYLHCLDPMRGTHHFDLPQSLALELHRQMAKYLPGYLLPRLVADIPNRDAKTLLV